VNHIPPHHIRTADSDKRDFGMPQVQSDVRRAGMTYGNGSVLALQHVEKRQPDIARDGSQFVAGSDSVYILFRGDRLFDFARGQMPGQRKLQHDAMNGRVLIQPGYQSKQHFFRCLFAFNFTAMPKITSASL